MGLEKVDKGEFEVGETVKVAYVDQQHKDIDPNKTVYQVISGGNDLIRMGNRDVNARAYLSRFNFSGSDQEKLCGMLSGGERNRLHLAMALKEEGNVLLLDEPTNGGIAMAGIIGIVRSWSIIKSAVSLAAKEMGDKKAEANVVRTQKDLSMKIIAIGSIITIILVALFFYFDVMQGNLLHTIVAIVLVAGISFLFTTVAANAIAIVGTNPVSGMTLMTLILASVVMVAVGLKGATGMVASLVMGGVVCTALSMAGGFITDLKIGYWLGSTPAKQQTWKFLGTLVSAATVGGVIMILNKTYGFSSGALAAPQANAMAAVIDPLMNGVAAPWLLYGIGAVLALVLTYFKVPALAFALGMFIPLELNLPLIVGGAINWYVTTRSKDKAVNTARGEKGTLLASGFIAGGALMGVVSAAMRFGGINLVNEAWLENPLSQVVSLVAYVLLIVYLVKASMNINKS